MRFVEGARGAFWLAIVLVGIGLAIVTRLGTRWPSVYFMTGPSMEPTIGAERYFLAWAPPGHLERGDLVIFRFHDVESDSTLHVLRRLVALAGDTVAMEHGVIVVNGEVQPWPFQILEPRASRSPFARTGDLYSWGPWIVPPDSVVLLADTRDMIGWPDSRFLGFLPEEVIVARATRTLRGVKLR